MGRLAVTDGAWIFYGIDVCGIDRPNAGNHLSTVNTAACDHKSL